MSVAVTVKRLLLPARLKGAVHCKIPLVEPIVAPAGAVVRLYEI